MANEAVADSPEPTPVSWLSLMRTVRAPLAVIVLSGIALVLPSQSRDMLAALGDGTLLPGPVFWFYLSLAALTFSGWYWSRALISARFDAPQTRAGQASLKEVDPRVDLVALDAVPWLIFLLSGLVGLGLIWKGGAWHAAWFLLLWVLVAVFFWPGRQKGGIRQPRQWMLAKQAPHRAVAGGSVRSTSKLGEWSSRIPQHMKLLTHRAPGGRWAAWAFIGIALAVFAWGAVASFLPYAGPNASLPLLLADRFPGPAAALICLSLMIAPLSVLTFLADGFRIEVKIGDRTTGPSRPPVILALLAITGLAPYFLHLHTVRVVDGKLPERQDLGQILDSWAATYAPENGPVRPIIVAVSGGASRAAVWGAQVLEEIEQSTVPGGPGVFAVSSVSGGSLGVAGYMSLLASLTDDERSADDKRQVRRRQVALLGTAPLGNDVLAPLLSGWLAVDIPRSLLSPFAAVARLATGGVQPRGGDRADALERAFETLWQDPWTSSSRGRFDSPFLSLFYEEKSGKYELRKGMPLWIGNGTDVSTGSRLLTVPFDPKAWPFGAARDVLSLVNADVPISTAINNTSRFPYLEPSGELLRSDPAAGNSTRSWRDRFCDQVRFCDLGPTDIVDGGYFENEGLQTALDLAAWLRTTGGERLKREVRPIIVQVTASGDPNGTPKDVMRWDSPADDPTELVRTRGALQLLAPVFGLYSVRGGHSEVLLRAARAQYGKDFVHFMLPGEKDREVPLNWVLSDKTTAFIRSATCEETITGNKQELERMQRLLANDRPAMPAGTRKVCTPRP